ncbi:MAG TPA: M36 family metallopeptidase [Candidatus Limnocylindrales bacterium]|nr:M36 family metallopeptidase [Candidatus Limnocylindrales bacterium]
MPIPQWTVPHRRGRTVAAALLTATIVAALTAPGASGAPAQPQLSNASQAGFGPDGHAARDKDNRTGVAAPSASQLTAARRYGTLHWNSLGTPDSVGLATSAGDRGAGRSQALAADAVATARQYLIDNQDLFGLDAAAVGSMDQVLTQHIGSGWVVQLQQRFGDLPAGRDGLASLLISADGLVVHVSSSLARDTSAPAPATLSAQDAFTVALADAGLSTDQLAGSDVRLVAVPTPTAGNRTAYEVTIIGKDTEDPIAYATYIDGITGGVLVREDLVDFDSDNPKWAVFPATPPQGTVTSDPRVVWCLTAAPGCVRQVNDPNSGKAWDVDLTTAASTFTTSGNSAHDFLLLGGGSPPTDATPSPERNYTYPFTDQWHAAKCDPATFTSAQRNDADAAIANLFAMHNRMHDWSYLLGFTEAAWNMQVVNLSGQGLGGDAEQGRVQAGALTGSRNNANQGTGRDGLPPTTNMFLWQPVAGAAYPPCVDGDYDMTVIGHEYTHAITNRMIAGPNTGIGGQQGGSMGEAWGDLNAAEYLYENGYRAPGDTPFVTGAYVTGNNAVGIRDYDGSKSPLNYSDIGFDLTGPEVHADGEIWVATNLRIRDQFVRRYGHGTPKLQLDCANGKVPADQCPGNRRWIQLVYDSFLLQASSPVSMLNMRDNMLAADMVRFGGANQDILWKAFAESGMGRDAATNGASDTDPTPSFASPLADNATVVLSTVGQSAGRIVRLYVGDYEARAVPIADTDPATPVPDTFDIVPNEDLHFTAVGSGLGTTKFHRAFPAGQTKQMRLDLPSNLAASANGATVSGDGVNLGKLVDETEATDWASLSGVAGKQVTVDLAGDTPQLVTRVNVSALLRPAIAGDVDPGGQNRFTALESFKILTCDAAVADCSTDAGYQVAYTSQPDAFPGGAFRPTAGQLNLRSFAITPSLATHVRLVVTNSQCTGNPLYAGEHDNDPRAATDCATASQFRSQVRVAELQVYSS